MIIPGFPCLCLLTVVILQPMFKPLVSVVALQLANQGKALKYWWASHPADQRSQKWKSSSCLYGKVPKAAVCELAIVRDGILCVAHMPQLNYG